MNEREASRMMKSLHDALTPITNPKLALNIASMFLTTWTSQTKRTFLFVCQHLHHSMCTESLSHFSTVSLQSLLNHNSLLESVFLIVLTLRGHGKTPGRLPCHPARGISMQVQDQLNSS
jgi:hypothetical protein